MGLLYSKQSPSSLSLPGYVDMTNAQYAPELKASSPLIDVVGSFPWTLTPYTSPARDETPFIFLKEYYVVDNAINQQLKPYGAPSITPSDPPALSDFISLTNNFVVNSDIDRLYEGFFDLVKPSGFAYKFPLFSQEMFSTSNSWEKKDLLNTIIDMQSRGVGTVARGLKKAFFRKKLKNLDLSIVDQIPQLLKEINTLTMQATNPSVGLFDPPHIWKGSSPREYSFSFVLYNTEPIKQEQKDVQNLILKNWELCYILSYQNSMNKRNFYTGLPPVFYRVEIPGIHYCKASCIKSLVVSNVGNVRRLKLPFDGGPERDVNIPDAYRIEITIQDFLMPSKNLLLAAVSGKQANTITTGTA